MLRKGGQSTSFVAGGRRTVTTTFEGGSELVEEYDLRTDELLVRKRRTKTALGADGEWEYLAGDAPVRRSAGAGLISESLSNPIFTRKDTERAFQWRVRNLPYPEENYDISVDHADRKVVIRTKNKKYYKRFSVPELDMLKAPYQEGALSWYHANNTLVVSYAKPKEVVDDERKDKIQRKKMMDSQMEDVPQCNQQ